MEVFLDKFIFPTEDVEIDFRWGIKETCYDTMYPFFILSKHRLERLDFEPITILYGGNGSGKSTALNIIAEKLGAKRDTLYNRSNFYEDYINLCECGEVDENCAECRIITSDDVFDFMLRLREFNETVDENRNDLMKEYYDVRGSHFQLRSIEDIDELRRVTKARRKTKSQFIRESVAGNAREHSNGESAYSYFTNKINENGLYLLDEPENSLSPERQLELLHFLEDSSRFFGCQFVIATHSPFLLSLKGAKIYDLDENPVDLKKWNELPNVLAYYEFFKSRAREFNEKEH